MSQAGSFNTGGGGGGGITTINLDDGSSVTGTTISLFAQAAFPNAGSSVTFTSIVSGEIDFSVTDANDSIYMGGEAGNVLSTGMGNTCLGRSSATAIMTGSSNVYIGAGTAANATSASSNVGIGYASMLNALTASGCVAIGSSSLSTCTGTNNTAVGTGSLGGLLSGSNNIAIGFNIGTPYVGAESDNIVIGAIAVVGESDVTRIGQNQTTCYVAGISGVMVANSAAVLIDTTNGQLGTVASSIRFKENVEDMGSSSDFIYKLRPVKFTLKEHPEYGQKTGLIAEEVVELAPQLVPLDKEGIPASVCYHELPALLLNEIQKLNKRIEDLERKIKA